MNQVALAALTLAGGGLSAVVGSVAYIARRAVEADADRAAAAIAEHEGRKALRARVEARRSTQKELVR